MSQRYKRERNWLPWIVIAILVAVVFWLWRKVRDLERELWQQERR